MTKKQNLFTKLQGLFQKEELTEKQYKEAQEAKQQELMKVQSQLQEKHDDLTELHKMKVLNQVEASVYDEHKAEYDQLQAKAEEIQNEMKLMKEYKTDDLQKVLAEMEEVKRDHSDEQAEKIQAVQLEALQAKYDYFEKLAEVRDKYNEAVQPQRKLDALQIKLGIKKNSYISGSHETLNTISYDKGGTGDVNTGHESLLVTQPELYDVLAYGTVPQPLKNGVQTAQKKGLLK